MNREVMQQLKQLGQVCDQPRYLPDWSVAAELENPLCGDSVSIQLKIVDARVQDIGHCVEGCLLCCAASGVLLQEAIGKSGEELVDMESGLREMLSGGAVVDEYADFSEAVSYPSRHSCILLALQATIKALETV